MIQRNATVSVVSHGQNALVNQLLADLAEHCSRPLEIIVTENIADPVPLMPPSGRHRFSRLLNERPRGFGANHNAAFGRSTSDMFFVVNPDIRLSEDPFPALAPWLEQARAAAVAPLVRSPNGDPEDSARRFPTVPSLLAKLLRGSVGPDYPTDQGPIPVDWVAGMFVGFRRDAYALTEGFDERYFLYYEDVDICRRLHAQGKKVVYDTTVSVIHDARRASRRDPRLMAIHAASALRYLVNRY